MTVPPADTKEYVQQLSQKTKKYLSERKLAGKPQSLNVYLGEFSDPVSQDQYRVLTQSHTLILDPFQPGVSQALTSLSERPTYVIGRIDVGALTAGVLQSDRIGKVKVITDMIAKHVGPKEDGRDTPFNGLLIANWDAAVTPGICNEILGYLHGLNLNVYNEITAPAFMDQRNAALNLELLAGVVFINAAIMPNGERRDYFNMLSMKTALEIVTAQSCIREFAVLMCEIVDDESTLMNAVVKRTFKWCRFYGAVAWIGFRAALKDATQNTVVKEPNAAFEWLKRHSVLDIHEIWRTNSKVFENAEKAYFRYPRTLLAMLQCIGCLNLLSLE